MRTFICIYAVIFWNYYLNADVTGHITPLGFRLLLGIGFAIAIYQDVKSLKSTP